MKRIKNIFLVVLLFLNVSCSDNKQSERLFSYFLNRHVEQIKPINKKFNEAIWATYSGKSSFSELLTETRLTDSLYRNIGQPTDYYQNLLNSVYDNSTDFELLMKIRKSGLISDVMLKRQFVDVFRNYITIQNNWDETDHKKTELYEQFFELKKTESSFWDSIRQVKGANARKEWIERFAFLTDDFREMIISMNSDASRLGYTNYYQLMMEFNGVEYKRLDELCRIVENETNEDYRKLLAISQNEICTKFDIEPSEIQAQHYSYAIKKMVVPDEWQKKYTQDECVGILDAFFAKGDYQIDDIIANSDLWYADNKMNQSFFCNIDVEKSDHRIYANVMPSTIGIYTLLHEMGHAVHYKYVDQKVPYLLKDPNEITTEAIAIYFNDKLYHSPTLRNMMGINDTVRSMYYQAFSDPTRLIFLRKLIRNIQFEKSIFENPTQDYTALWWQLTQNYLLYEVQEEDHLPEWVSDQHIINASGIHVSYLYAFAFAAQLEVYFPDDNIAAVKDLVMKFGDTMDWNEILKNATGEDLNLNYLFNSYRLKNRSKVPIAFDVKIPSKFSFIEKRIDEGLIDRELFTIQS
ncbi:MAG: hypothetical protein ACERKD_05790 [Prolixibacteraceae bacterium]